MDDLVGALTNPIIVMPEGWGDALPDWIKSQITLDRLGENIRALKGEQPTGTDAEACAYLYTCSLEAPMDSDWTRIYLYIAGKVIARAKGINVPEDIKIDSLSDYQIRLLKDLKGWIYDHRVKVRKERQRVEKRQAKTEAAAKVPVQLKLGV
jgi:hypothetical protein